MDWMNWILLIVVLVATSVIVYLRLKGYIATDAATLCIGAVIELVRKAEELWRDYQGAGVQKKAWVLAQLRELGDQYDATVAGPLIDAVVAWLNSTNWG